MTIPEADLQRIRSWCVERVPTHVRDRLRVESEIAPRHVTISEHRPPWRGTGEWTAFPVARLRYTMKSGEWQLYWRDQNSKFHSYEFARPTARVQTLLDSIERDEHALFWG